MNSAIFLETMRKVLFRAVPHSLASQRSHPVRPGGQPVNELVALILSEPGMADRLLAIHADDGTGHCRVCSGGGQSGRDVWPCTIHECARRASVLERPDNYPQRSPNPRSRTGALSAAPVPRNAR